MASPVVESDIVVLSDVARVCDRMQALLALPSQVKSFLGWLLTSTGEISDAVVLSISDRLTPIGGIILWGAPSLPSTNWLLANGQTVSRTTYATLFARYGVLYGAGDGSTTFSLPNLSEKFPIGVGGAKSLASVGGEETHTLTAAEMPVHNHANGDYDSILKPTEEGSITGSDTSNSLTEANVTTSAVMSDAGEGAAHNNLPPYIAMHYIIKAL